ncbi:MAG: acyl carrier protein [Puniceicoccales bacterium]|jgi:acyl carrier protein|nr:acyl carrier protein [Puniceicoccales bacterium]MDR0755840.1 acyl carrier protein [Puniceicoccales bacterium]MDR1254682.1 acyl carrier protein [Puniceicoccales bacterium]
MTETIEQRVKRVIANTFSVKEEQVTPEASFTNDLSADSLDQVQLIMDLEEEFKDLIEGEIPEADAEKLKTVGEVIQYIVDKANNK